MTGKNAGSRPEGRARSSRYDIIDDCDKCTLGKYVRMVCDDDLSALVISGEPPRDVLEAASVKIVSEFSVLSGSSDKAMNTTRMVYFYHSLILAYSICQSLIASGDIVEAVRVLNEKGVRCSEPGTEEEALKLLKRIKSAITEKTLRLREEERKLARLRERKGGKATREDFMNTLVALSKNAGFRMTMDISLSEYAAYLKDYKHEIEQLKNLRNGKNHTK